MKILTTILFAIVALLFVSSCSIFRSRTSQEQTVQVRDSIGQLDSIQSISTYSFETEDKEVVTLQAKGFTRIQIDSQGNLYAEGEQGELAVSKAAQSKSLGSGQSEEVQVSKSSSVQDSSTRTVDKSYSYTAEPDTWSVTWIGVVVIIVVLGGLIIFLKRVL